MFRHMISITMENNATLPSPFDRLPKTATGIRVLSAGQVLFRQGDYPKELFFVGSGGVDLIRHTKAGRRVIVFRARTGDTLAEASLFSDQYHCDGIAVSDSSIITVNNQAVLQQMAVDPAFSAALVQRSSGQIQGYRRKLEFLAIGSAKERVLAGLSDGWLTGTVLEFASELGLSHEATYRALKELVQDGHAQKLGRGQYCAVEE